MTNKDIMFCSKEDLDFFKKKIDAVKNGMEVLFGKVGNLVLTSGVAVKLLNIGDNVRSVGFDIVNSADSADKASEVVGSTISGIGLGASSAGVAVGAYGAYCVCKLAKDHKLKEKFSKAAVKFRGMALKSKFVGFVKSAKESVSSDNNLVLNTEKCVKKSPRTVVIPLNKLIDAKKQRFNHRK